MTNFQIGFSHPLLLLLLIPALFFALFPYFRMAKRYRRTRNRVTSIVLHILVMVLSISVLSGVGFSYEIPNRQNELILLVDRSFSNRETEEAKDRFVQSVLNASDPSMKVGIVTFGYTQVYAVPLTDDKSRAFEQYTGSERPDDSATDIASALQYASGLFENPETAKIVLLTDGVETDRSAASIIRSIAVEGIKVDTVRFPAEKLNDEVLLLEVALPDYNIVVNDDFQMVLTLQSSYVGNAKITLYDNEEPSGEPREITLVNGKQTVEFSHAFEEQGLHAISFEIESAAEDTLMENNIFHSYIYLEVFDDVLIIERNADESDRLVGLLDSNFNVKVVSVFGEDMPSTLNDLRQYDEIILMNIANADMPVGFVDLLYAYVNDVGGGLFTVGGNKEDEAGNTVANTYDRTDMAGTLYQQMLPVQAIDYTPPVGVVIVIDRSGSMDARVEGSGKTKLDLAKDGAMSSLLALTERDYCGVMTLEEDYSEDLELTPLPQRAKIEAAIEKIEIGGGTVFSGALERAGSALMGLRNVERRHIILVTDGEPTNTDPLWADPNSQVGGYGGVIKNNFNSGITLSIVAIGVDSTAARNMQEAANVGGGEFYNIWDGSTLPGIMREDMDIPQIIAYNPEPFTPTVRDHTAVLNGVDVSTIPQLGGFYGTKIKEGTTVPLKAEFVPVYAQWKFGAGMVGSFMCDLNGTWSADFLSSESGYKILTNIVNGLFPTKNIKPGSIEATINEDNYGTQMSVFTSLNENETLQITITSPSGDNGLPQTQTFTPVVTDGFSRVDFTVRQAGLHEILIEKKSADGEVSDSLTTYRTFSYSEEYNVFVDEAASTLLLQLLAENGRGAVVAAEQPQGVFEGFKRTLEREFDPRWLFIIIALVLFLLDIAVRKFKFKWPHEIVRDRKLKKELEQDKK